MNDDTFNPMGTPEFTFRRGPGAVTITPCPDGENGWHWTYMPDNRPETVQVPTGYVDFETGQRATAEVPWQPEVAHASNEQIVTSLGTPELRDLLGFLAHVNEHMLMHIGQLLSGMVEAHTAHQWDGLTSLNTELYACLNVRATAGQLGKMVYDALESAPATNEIPAVDG